MFLSQIRNKKLGLGWFFTGVLFLVLCYIFGKQINSIHDGDKIRSKIQKELNRKQEIREYEIGMLIKKYRSEGSKTSASILTRLRNNSLAQGIDYFIYRGDTLLFWSTNTISPTYTEGVRSNQEHYIKKMNNGWYDILVKRQGTYTFISTILIKHEYPFQNNYLKDDFAPSFGVNENIQVLSGNGNYPIYSSSGKVLFSIDVKNASFDDCRYDTLFLILFILAAICFLCFLYRVYQFIFNRFSNPYWFVFGFTIDVVLLRLFQLYFKLPGVLYSTKIFGPAGYSSSFIFPSLGDFLINSICILACSYVFYRYWPKFKTTKWIFYRVRPIISIIFFLHVLAGFYLVVRAMNDLVVNSSIPLNLQNISSLSGNSIFGFLIICSLFLSLWLASIRFLEMAQNLAGGLTMFLTLSGMVLIGSLILVNNDKLEDLFISGIFYLIYIFIYLFFSLRNNGYLRLSSTIVFLIFFSVFATTALNKANKNNEQEKRKILALKLSSRKNPVTEVFFTQAEKGIVGDTIIKKWFNDPQAKGQISEENLITYLKANYFKDYWNRYNIQVTLCYPNKVLQIQPQDYLISCHEYFKNIIKEYGEPTNTGRLFYLDYGFGSENYLALFTDDDHDFNGNRTTAILVELNSKSSLKDVGYPELLMDQKLISLPDLTDYGYAFFQNGRLIHGVGKYAYHFNLDFYRDTISDDSFLVKDGMSHYLQKLDHSNTVVISRAQESILTIISPFSYLLIFFTLFVLIFYGFIHFPDFLRFSLNTLSDRLQVAMVGTLILSFIIIGIVLVLYITRLNEDKNAVSLRERALSIRIELQHKMGGSKSLATLSRESMENLLVKFSNVFFSDINIFNPSGELAATSRPEIFKEGLISTLINPNAYYHLVQENNSLFIQEECIGKLKYNSAYVPFFNEQADLLGYLNLPYFSRQDDLRREISGLLVAFINIYILLILLSIFITFIISRYIASPLSLLADKMAVIQIGRNNERIKWKHHDEIGRLVEEYNRMIGELERSAERLAKSERESAWREMARQVAHEIKNPLTPMKLNIQYLQRAWKDGASDWEARLDRFSASLIEQIDTLSVIASEFSDFAKMPEPANEKLELYHEIHSVLQVYKDITHIGFLCNQPAEKLYIWADRKQLNRVFTNLLNNSIQAIGDNPQGLIIIEILKSKENIILNIIDNGMGIAPEQVSKIFQPNFTTKSSGMGLGLAIVKGILTSMRGEISFESTESRGTTFSISLPGYEAV